LVARATTPIPAVGRNVFLNGNRLGRTQSSNRQSPEEQVRAIDARSPSKGRFIEVCNLRGGIGHVYGVAVLYSR
jgi:hypothetical protein